MRKIKPEIEQYMTGLTREGGKLTAHFSFPPEFIGFQGHFPEKKVLPGACQIQCAISLLETGMGTAVVLKEIVLANYVSPLFPGDELTCVAEVTGDAGGDSRVTAVITKNTVPASEIHLLVSFAEQDKNRQG